MPADMLLHVVFEGLLRQLEGFVAMALGIEYERFHRLRVAMFRVLFEHLVRSFEA